MLLCHEGMGIHVHTWAILGCHSRIISWCLGHKCPHAHHVMQYVPWLFALLAWVCMFTYDLCFCSILGQHKPMWARPQHRATVAWAHIFNATPVRSMICTCVLAWTCMFTHMLNQHGVPWQCMSAFHMRTMPQHCATWCDMLIHMPVYT